MKIDITELGQIESFNQGMTEPERGEDTTDKLDLSKIDNIEFDDIDYKDAPDYVDAWICSADYDGVPMTDDQIYDLNENHIEFVYEKLIEYIY